VWKQNMGETGWQYPRGWAFCDGQLLPISENTALFSLVGTIYGGDGRTTFALPDLRGRVAVHAGSGPGLEKKRLGEKSGSSTVTLTQKRVAAAAEGEGEAVTASQGVSVEQPSLAVNYIICLSGIFPSRN
jgi:microcystin-dependent protein